MVVKIYGWAVGSVCPGQGVLLATDVKTFTNELVTSASGEDRQVADSKSFQGEAVDTLSGEDRQGNDTFSRAESLTIVNT